MVVGDDEDVVWGAAGLDALDERSLVGVDDIDLVPLEEEAGHGYSLAGHDVSGAVFGVHA